MSGQPTPSQLLTEAFGVNAGTGYITKPIPVPSQISTDPAAASLNDGFPPLTMTDPLSGGIPPYGEDMNGVLYLISAWVAFLAAGQISPYSSALKDAMGGYALGAVVVDATDETKTWTSTTSGNADDPATTTTNWRANKPLHAAVTAAAGANNDVALPGPSDFIYDVDCTAGAASFSGFVAQVDGQKLTIRKSDAGSNALTLAALTGSGAANQLQITSFNISLPFQWAVATIQYSAALSKWVQI